MTITYICKYFVFKPLQIICFLLQYNIYYYGFIFCETLNIFIVVVVYFLTNKILNGKFLFYGMKTLMYYRLPYEEQKLSVLANPMCEAFPRIAACDYHRFGSGGLQEKVNAICILALNVINDKVSYLFQDYYSAFFINEEEKFMLFCILFTENYIR